MPPAAQHLCTDQVKNISTKRWKNLLAGDTRFTWEWCGEDPLIAAIEVSGNIVSLTSPSFMQAIHLETTPCHYGGSRVWFICPACGKRTTKLYLCQLNLSCRACSNLVYRSQRTTKADRLLMKAAKISKRLGNTGKPKYMKQATFQELLLKHNELMTESAWLYISAHKRMANAVLDTNFYLKEQKCLQTK